MLRNIEYGSMNRRFAQIRREEIIRDQERVPVTLVVDQDLLKTLQNDYGFTKFGAARALYVTGGKDIDKVVEYIEKHQEDKDFNTLMEISAPTKFSKDLHKPAKKEVVKEKSKPTAETKKAFHTKLLEDAKKLELHRGTESTLGLGVRVEAKEDLEDLLRLRESGDWRKDQELMLAPKERPVFIKEISFD